LGGEWVLIAIFRTEQWLMTVPTATAVGPGNLQPFNDRQYQFSKEKRTMTFLKNFLNDEQGQDMVEYTLILAFVAMAVGALYKGMSTDVLDIWTKASGHLSDASAAAK
jgi:Flp pilus assembly pilin Flp